MPRRALLPLHVPALKAINLGGAGGRASPRPTGLTGGTYVAIIGALAHGIDLPAERRGELQGLGQMRSNISLGCIGRRIDTDLEDGEGSLAVPGTKLGAVTQKLVTLVEANRGREWFHRTRQEAG